MAIEGEQGNTDAQKDEANTTSSKQLKLSGKVLNKIIFKRIKLQKIESKQTNTNVPDQ